MAKLEPLKVTGTPCPECGSRSTSLETSHYDPEDGCLYDDYLCDACGQKWAEKLTCDETVENVYAVHNDIDDDDTGGPLYPTDYPDFGWEDIFPPPDDEIEPEP